MKETGGKKGARSTRGTITQISSGRFHDGYTSPDQPRDTYLTTYDMVEELGEWVKDNLPNHKSLPYNESIRRWCRKWFGSLPHDRIGGRGAGYRIPVPYRYVARAWWQSQDEAVREVAKRVLLADPKPWIVVVGKFGSTHYSVAEVLERVNQVLSGQSKQVEIIYVGPMEENK